jgi:hypothetical protein
VIECVGAPLTLQAFSACLRHGAPLSPVRANINVFDFYSLCDTRIPLTLSCALRSIDPSAGFVIVKCSTLGQELIELGLTNHAAQSSLRELTGGEEIILNHDRRFDRITTRK